MSARNNLYLNQIKARLTWSGVALMLLLQRTPVPSLVAESRLSLGPKWVHVLKWVVGAGITSAFHHTVTGATGDLSVAGNITAILGENVQVAITADKAVPVTVRVEHPTDGAVENPLPPGISSNVGVGGTVQNGIIAFSGIPVVTGEYPVRVTVLTWEDQSTYTGDPVFITFNFKITLEGPIITELPVSKVVPYGTTAQLNVEVADEDGVTYQWQRNVGASLDEYSDMPEANQSIYSVPNATSEIDGSYRVRVFKDSMEVITPAVFLTVKDYDSWRERNFDEPDQLSGELDNPDGDAFNNAFEFYFDFEPLKPNSFQAPRISSEVIDGINYLVLTYPKVFGGSKDSFDFEKTDNLVGGEWTKLTDGVGGVVIETSDLGSILKVPASTQAFYRMTVTVFK